MSETKGYELGWDSAIENDGPEFTVLPEGDYDFVVEKFERGRHPGSDKLPPCNKAVIHLNISGEKGSTQIKHQLFLHSNTEGLLCAFFTGIGQRKKGERVTMDWGRVTGARGKCKIGVRKWQNTNTGEEMTGNEIKKFYEPAEGASPVQGYTPGRF